jgi:hypothetical protein
MSKKESDWGYDPTPLREKENKMIETTKEICQMCGKEYDDTHIVPKTPFAPRWCPECEEEANKACDGSWIGAAYSASKNPWEEAD